MQLVNPHRYVALKASGQLPSPKGLAFAIVRMLQRDDCRIDDIVKLIQSDPAIAGELLKFSNAATFGHSRPIISLSKAITTLGTFRVRVLILAFSVLHNHRDGNCPQFNYEQFWARSLATAISAQALAASARINAEENFTAGLLCGVGELALASVFPDRYGEIISMPGLDFHKRLEMEQDAFGNNHRELNATMLLEWGLPEVVVTAIYHAEAPDEAGFQDGSRTHGLALSLHVALAMAKICVADDGARWAMLPNLYAKAARLGITTGEMNSIADAITASWLEWGEKLKIQTREISSFADLLASSQPRDQAYASASCSGQNDRNILLICAESAETSAMIRHLQQQGYGVKYTSSSARGFEWVMRDKPDLLIVEMSSPEIDGASFCNSLRSQSHGQSPHIIFVADKNYGGLLAQALGNGADDILLRPVTDFALEEKLHGAFKIIQLQNELIKERNELVSSAGEWAGANRRLTHVAMTDPLTQLSNRRHGMDTFSAEWAFARANNLPLACMMIDIDYFKSINDMHGHKAGDAVLIILAILLQTGARTEDLVFRFGGEEFCVICPGVSLETANEIAERIRRNVESQPFQLGKMDIELTVSIGVAMMLPKHTNEEDLIHDADAALYCAKNGGRNRVESGVPEGQFNR